jgi:hypothetical protein
MMRLYMGFRVAGPSQRLYRHGRREGRSCSPTRSGEDALTDLMKARLFTPSCYAYIVLRWMCHHLKTYLTAKSSSAPCIDVSSERKLTMLLQQQSGGSKSVSSVQTSERANNNAKILGMTIIKFLEAIKAAAPTSRSVTVCPCFES